MDKLRTAGMILSVLGCIVTLATESIRHEEIHQMTEEMVQEEINKRFDEMSKTKKESE